MSLHKGFRFICSFESHSTDKLKTLFSFHWSAYYTLYCIRYIKKTQHPQTLVVPLNSRQHSTNGKCISSLQVNVSHVQSCAVSLIMEADAGVKAKSSRCVTGASCSIRFGCRCTVRQRLVQLCDHWLYAGCEVKKIQLIKHTKLSCTTTDNANAIVLF